jgi:hypothetical protein
MFPNGNILLAFTRKRAKFRGLLDLMFKTFAQCRKIRIDE